MYERSWSIGYARRTMMEWWDSQNAQATAIRSIKDVPDMDAAADVDGAAAAAVLLGS